MLAVSLSGCWPCPEIPEPEIVIEYEYVYQKIPELQQRPMFQEYDMNMVRFKGQDFYVIPRVDGSIMSSNWTAYRGWAEANYSILQALKDSNTSKD